LERDDVFGDSESRKKMILRTPSPIEMIPTVIKEGKPATEFEPDFFIVSLVNGQPKGSKDYNYLKNYDFPVLSKENKQILGKEYKDYIRRHKGEPSQRKFACFQLILYLADVMDIDTALSIADQVA
jgi:nuclear protein localization family protein 4